MTFEHVDGISLQSQSPEVTHFYLWFKNVCILISVYTIIQLFFPQYVLCIFSNQLLYIYNVIINGYVVFHCGGVHDSQLSIDGNVGCFQGFFFCLFVVFVTNKAMYVFVCLWIFVLVNLWDTFFRVEFLGQRLNTLKRLDNSSKFPDSQVFRSDWWVLIWSA